jgi:hypothetical protein
MGAPQGTSMSSVPTGASAGLDAGANGQIEIKDSVIGPDSTIAAVLRPPVLLPLPVRLSPRESQGYSTAWPILSRENLQPIC